jgi:NADH-quinone oxidoreductase subunit L
MTKDSAWLILWLPLLGFLFNAFSGYIFKNKETQKKVVANLAWIVVLVAFGVTCLIFGDVMAQPEKRAVVGMFPPGTPWSSPDSAWIDMGGFRVNFGLLLDPLSMLMALIVTGIGGLIHIYAAGYMKEDRELPRFFTYFNLFIFMMLLLVMGENFLLMFVGWEGVGSCSYLLISFWYTTTENAKAGNKAFIVNRVGDVGFALGMMAVWSLFGTLSFFSPSNAGTGVMEMAAKGTTISGAPLSSISFFGTTAITATCILLFVGAMGKSAQIPLWVWLPDAMAGPTPVSALIHAATMVTAGVVMVTRCSWLFVWSPAALQTVALIGVLTALMGATIGLVQNDIKRVLAFSTVSQLGYMFLACGVGQFALGMYHVTTHAFFKALLFLGSGAVIHSMLGEQDMRRMGGLKKLIPITHWTMFAGYVAIAGLPPFSGFFSKDEILHAASGSPWGNGMILYGIGLFTALLTAFYMSRMMWKTFWTNPRFEDGKLVAHHHGNFLDDPHGHHHAEHDAHHNAAHDDELGADAEPVETHVEDQEHGHGHHGEGTGKVHESPFAMWFPLAALAIPSLFFALVINHHTFELFLEPSIANPENFGIAEGHHPFSVKAGYGISTFIAIVGIVAAYVLYNKHRATGELSTAEQKSKNTLWRFLDAKWYWDAFYNTVFIKLGGIFAERFLWKTVDAGLIDGTVNGIAGGVGWLSKTTRRFQTGFVRNYALIMVLGVVILISSLLYKWKEQEKVPVVRPSNDSQRFENNVRVQGGPG